MGSIPLPPTKHLQHALKSFFLGSSVGSSNGLLIRRSGVRAPSQEPFSEFAKEWRIRKLKLAHRGLYYKCTTRMRARCGADHPEGQEMLDRCVKHHRLGWLAQLVEHLAFNQGVMGSSPLPPTSFYALRSDSSVGRAMV